MAIKINTLEMLLEELDQDLQWRKKEILDIRTLIIANDYLPCLLRSCFTRV